MVTWKNKYRKAKREGVKCLVVQCVCCSREEGSGDWISKRRGPQKRWGLAVRWDLSSHGLGAGGDISRERKRQ